MVEDKIKAWEAERYRVATTLYMERIVRLTKSQLALGTLKNNNNDPSFYWYLLSKETDRRVWVGRGNRKNSDLIMNGDGEIIGFMIGGKTYM